MKNILIIAKKELMDYFRKGTGFIFAVLLITITNWMFFSDLFVTNRAEMGPYFEVMMFLFSIFVPAISMGILAEERKNGNWEVLLTLPVSETEIVMGKFLGNSFFLLMTILLSLPTIITLGLIGQPDWGMVFGGLMGVFLLGLSYLAVGILASSMTSEPVVGFLGATAFLLINNLTGQATVRERLPDWLGSVVGNINLWSRIGDFGNGLVEIANLFFYLSFMTICLVLAVMVWKRQHK